MRKASYIIFTFLLIIGFLNTYSLGYTSEDPVIAEDNDLTAEDDTNQGPIAGETSEDTLDDSSDPLEEPAEPSTSTDSEETNSEESSEQDPQAGQDDLIEQNNPPASDAVPEVEENQAIESTVETPQQPKLIDTLNKKNMWHNKTVYLTFDDGPSKLTTKVLEVLEKEEIKATFFVAGIKTDEQKALLKRIDSEGHAIGNHTYSHNYDYIYKNVDNFFTDLYKNEGFIYEAIGKRPRIIRFPGGSKNNTSNTENGKKVINEILERLVEEGYVHFDWNASSGDASVQPATVDQIINNVLKWVGNNNDAVVLFHDTASKKNTLEALPIIIEKLKFLGCKFEVLTIKSPHIAFVKAKPNSDWNPEAIAVGSRKPLHTIKKLYNLEIESSSRKPPHVIRKLHRLDMKL